MLEQAVGCFHGRIVKPFGPEFEHGAIDHIGNLVSRQQLFYPELSEEEDEDRVAS
jgi:hypothetical protein